MNKGRVVWTMCVGIALFLFLGLPDDALAFQCCGTICCDICNTVCTECSAGQGCSVTTACLDGIPIILPSCTSSGGGGCGGCHGRICCQGSSLDVTGVSAETVMEKLTNENGMRFQAGAIGQRPVTLKIPAMDFIAWTNEIGRQLDSVPVYRGKYQTIEYIPRNLVDGFHYSLEATKGSLDIAFVNTDVRDALLSIAYFGKIDMVFPEGLHGTVDADYNGKKMGWDEVLRDVLDRTNNQKEVLVAPNGLVWFSPHK